MAPLTKPTYQTRRVELQKILEEILGSNQVYFQPKENIKMEYPSIVYQRSSMNTRFADNRPYASTTRYQVTLIDRNPDTEIPSKLAELPRCTMDRFYIAENLNHYTFNLYF